MGNKQGSGLVDEGESGAIFTHVRPGPERAMG